jgi:hypothetical protein
MTTKAQIVEELGKTGLVLPQPLAAALAANDRAKYYMSLLQGCRQQAHERLMQSLADMMAPLRVGAAPLARPLDVYEQRLTTLRDRLSPGRDGTVDSTYINDVTRTDREGPDSIHLLVMDLGLRPAKVRKA